MLFLALGVLLLRGYFIVMINRRNFSKELLGLAVPASNGPLPEEKTETEDLDSVMTDAEHLSKDCNRTASEATLGSLCSSSSPQGSFVRSTDTTTDMNDVLAVDTALDSSVDLDTLDCNGSEEANNEKGGFQTAWMKLPSLSVFGHARGCSSVLPSQFMDTSSAAAGKLNQRQILQVLLEIMLQHSRAPLDETLQYKFAAVSWAVSPQRSIAKSIDAEYMKDDMYTMTRTYLNGLVTPDAGGFVEITLKD